jgi:DNA-binding CsgD family transcriptional regulator
MPNNNLFLQTIDAIYASGLDSGRWPEALKSTTSLLGGVGTFLEVVDKRAQARSLFCAVGAPSDAHAHSMRRLAALAARVPSNPRMSSAFHRRVGHVAWDHQILDEAGMARDPFYAEFLPQFGVRYFLGAVIEQTSEKFAFVSVQRTAKQGHVDKREIGLMQRLCPHFQRAHDMATRLSAAGDSPDLLENTLDWLADGVALLRADGDIVYANDTMRALAQRGDGFRIVDRAFEFAEPATGQRFDAMLGAIERLGNPSCDGHSTDFPIPRNDEMPAYIVSVRPLVYGPHPDIRYADADVIVVIRDPFERNTDVSQMLQRLFGLTSAEARLARALCAGVTTTAYALERRVSINTVYSHLKRIREKTGCRSVPELIRKFGKSSVPATTDLINVTRRPLNATWPLVLK